MYNRTNFSYRTIAEFVECELPLTKPDYTSFDRHGNVSSKYYFGEDEGGEFVIRFSSHWSNINSATIGSCIWTIKLSNKSKKRYWRAGKAYFSLFI